MASTLALRALGAIALPGAVLAVAAPTASAAEIAPLSHMGADATQSTESDAAAGEASALPETSQMLSGKSITL